MAVSGTKNETAKALEAHGLLSFDQQPQNHLDCGDPVLAQNSLRLLNKSVRNAGAAEVAP